MCFRWDFSACAILTNTRYSIWTWLLYLQETYWVFSPVYPAVTWNLAGGETNSSLCPQSCFSSWLPWQTLSACQACSLEGSLTCSSPSSTERTRRCILLNAPLERVLYLPLPSHCCHPIQAFTCSYLLDESLPPHYSSMHLHLITPVSCPIILGWARRWLGSDFAPFCNFQQSHRLR